MAQNPATRKSLRHRNWIAAIAVIAFVVIAVSFGI